MTSVHDLFCVDAFAARPGAGNPAGICLLEQPADPVWMQRVAREMNLSETAFLLRAGDGYHLRWFTPRVEVELCGHATLAAAHILWQEGLIRDDEPARFYTKSGALTAIKKDDRVEMDFPQEPEEPAVAPSMLTEALGIDPCYVGRNRFDYLVEVASERIVRDMQPDFSCLARVPVRGVIVTSRASQPGIDFISRFFAPAAGVNEDPVTGSAHCCLAPYWGKKLHRDTLVGYQASERGGTIAVRICENGRVILSGTAVTVWKGSRLI